MHSDLMWQTTVDRTAELERRAAHERRVAPSRVRLRDFAKQLLPPLANQIRRVAMRPHHT